jgi:hypothetical protein
MVYIPHRRHLLVAFQRLITGLRLRRLPLAYIYIYFFLLKFRFPTRDTFHKFSLHKDNKHVEKTVISACVYTYSSASQTAQQLDPSGDALAESESEDDADTEQEAESSTQATDIESDEEETADNSVRSARHF